MASFYDADDDDAVVDMLYNRSRDEVDRQEREWSSRSSAGRGNSRLEQATYNLYDRVRRSRIYRAAQSTTRRVRNAGKHDLISLCEDIGDFQHACSRMEDEIMAHIPTRRRYQARRLEGYLGSYRERDPYGNAIGHSHPTYQVIMNEVVAKDEDGSVWATSYTMSEDSRASVDLHDRTVVRWAWGTQDDMLEESKEGDVEDFTSKHGAML